MKPSLAIKIMAVAALSCMLYACIDDDIPTIKEEVVIGDRLPEFTVQMSDGSSITSSSLQIGVSLVSFFHTSCPDCRQALPILQQIYDEYIVSGVRFAIISREEQAPSITAYWESNGLTMPFSAQSNRTIYELFAKSRIPRVYINKDGVIHYIFTDNPVPTYEELKSALDGLLR